MTLVQQAPEEVGPAVGPARLGRFPDPMTVPYRFITTTDELLAVCRVLKAADVVAIDTETEVIPDSDLDRDGPGPWAVTSIAASFGPAVREQVWVVDMTNIDCAAVAPAFDGMTCYAWNANFERKVFERDGIAGIAWRDLMLAKAVLDLGIHIEGRVWYAALAQAGREYCGVELEGKGNIQLSFKPGVPLTDEQKAYAAQDAVVTLWLHPILIGELTDAGLMDAFDLEVGAQPFIDNMTQNGVPFDVEGWLTFLETKKVDADAQLVKLAALTGGGQATLFDPRERPTWNVNSDQEVKRVLNTYARDEVLAFTGKGGEPHLLGKEDSVDKDTLTQMGGDLAATILAYRKAVKLVTTYGEDQLKLLWDDGRYHPRFNQALVQTGRLSSDRPNFQNQPPESKRYSRPKSRRRVIVAGDLSQAELRYVSQVSGDEELRGAFRRGEDTHVTTASRMFGLDMLALKAEADHKDAIDAELNEIIVGAAFRSALAPWADRPPLEQAERAIAGHLLEPTLEAALRERVEAHDVAAAAAKKFKEMRSKGKTLNFGVVYGLRAGSLATRLTVGGVPTTREEASELLKLYARAYPGVDAWLAKRDAFVDNLAKNPPKCDWEATWLLHRLWKKCNNAWWTLKKRNGAAPSPEEISEQLAPRHLVERELERKLGHTPSAEEIEEELRLRAETIVWVRSFRGPVVVTAEGRPFAFESRTAVGRRRVYNVSADEWLSSMMMIAARSRKDRPMRVRDRWAKEHNASLVDKFGKPLSMDALRKKFEDKDLKADFVTYVLGAMPEAAEYLMTQALADCIRSKGNQYRNAPIQGGVADAVLYAYGLLYKRLRAFPSAKAVLSVHDSVEIECDVTDARAVSALLKETMEEALARYCPDVPVVADVDVQASRDAADKLSEEEIDARIAEVAEACATTAQAA